MLASLLNDLPVADQTTVAVSWAYSGGGGGGAVRTAECISGSVTLDWNVSLMLHFFFFFYRRQREIFLGELAKVFVVVVLV